MRALCVCVIAVHSGAAVAHHLSMHDFFHHHGMSLHPLIIVIVRGANCCVVCLWHTGATLRNLSIQLPLLYRQLTKQLRQPGTLLFQQILIMVRQSFPFGKQCTVYRFTQGCCSMGFYLEIYVTCSQAHSRCWLCCGGSGPCSFGGGSWSWSS